MAIMIIYMCLIYEHESCIVYSRNKVCHWNVLNGGRRKEEQEQVNQSMSLKCVKWWKKERRARTSKS